MAFWRGQVGVRLPGEGHADSVLRSQDDHWARFDRLVRNQLKIVRSEQSAQNHEYLQHRVVTADTATRSASEGQMSEGRVQRRVRFGETLRVETLRARPVARRMVRTVYVHNDRRSSGDFEISYAVVGDSHA